MNGELKGKKITSRVIVLKHEKRIATSLKIKIQNYPQRTYLLKYVRNRECIIVHLNRSGTKQTSFCLAFFHRLSLLSSFIPLVSHSYSLGSLQRNQTTQTFVSDSAFKRTKDKQISSSGPKKRAPRMQFASVVGITLGMRRITVSNPLPARVQVEGVTLEWKRG